MMSAEPEPEPPLPDDPDGLAEQFGLAFAQEKWARAHRILDLLARADLPPDRRLWAVRMRVLVVKASAPACAQLDAFDAFIEATADVPHEAVRRMRFERERAGTVAECEASRRPEPPLPAAAPLPEPPPRGRGTLALGAGALVLEDAHPRCHASLIAAEASLGYAWPGGFQIEGAVLASIESAVLRAGVRADLVEVVDGGPLQLRLAGQMMAGVRDELRIAGGVLVGVGLLLPLVEEFGLLGAVEASLWPSGPHISADGRVGIFYAF